MSLSNFRLPSPQPDLEFVKVIADKGKVRAVAQVARGAIDDGLTGEEYQRSRFAIVEKNLELIGGIIQAKYDAGRYTDYTDSLGIKSGNDKLIVITRGDLMGRLLSPP
jgi:hypothetical protein